MKNKLLLVTIVLLLALFISGCRDRYDVDELAIVIGLGVDRVRGSEPILLTVQVVNTAAVKSPGAEGGSQTNPVILLSSQGKSLLEASRNLTKISSHRIYFPHTKIIVLGKNLAESDISETMDYIARSRDFRRTNPIVVAERTAREILEAKMDMDKLPALGVNNMLTSKEQTFVYPINTNDFMLYLKTDIGVSYAPLMQLKSRNQESSPKLEQVAGKPAESSDEIGPAIIHLEKMAIFKNTRLVGTLNEVETKGFLWLINKVKGDSVVIPYQSAEGTSEIALEIVEGKTKVIPHITDKGTTMEIVCTGEAVLRESRDLSPQLKDLEMYKQLEKEAEKVLKTRVEQTVDRAQQDLKVDFLGFGNQIHNYNPAEWRLLKEHWDQRFLEIPHTVTFRVTIVRAGITKGSALFKSKGE